MNKPRWMKLLAIAGALLAPALATPAFAEDAPAKKISGTVGVDFASHFISYGYDVWGTGNDFTKNPTVNPWAEVVVNFDLFAVKVGTWWDVNSNTTSAIGGRIQEVDTWYGVVIPVDKFTVSLVYQDWNYAGTVEQVFDASVSFDDSEILGAYALKPSLTWHHVFSDDIGGKDHGNVVNIGIAPGLTVYKSEAVDVNLSFPVNVLIGDQPFYAEGGFAYLSAGVAAGVPLKFIPASYGAWTATTTVKYNHGEADKLPGNPDQDYMTATFGLSVGF